MNWINTRLTDMVTKTKEKSLQSNLKALATSYKTKEGEYPLESQLRLTLAIFLKRIFKFTKLAKEFPSSTGKWKIGDSWYYVPFTGEADTSKCGEVFKGYMARTLQCYGSGLELLRGTDEEQAKMTYEMFTKLKTGIEAVHKDRKKSDLTDVFAKIVKPGCSYLNRYMTAHKT